MRRRIALGVGVVVLAGWWLSSSDGNESPIDGELPAGRTITNDFRGALANARERGGRIPLATITPIREGEVAISGTVIDQQTNDPVGNVEVVFRGTDGEETTMAGADGTYRIELPAGAYRAFVRDDSVFTVGYAIEERLPGFPDLDAIGAPDEAAMPLVIAQQDLEHVELAVLRGGVVHGRILDRAGRPIPNVVVHAYGTGGFKPALGSDVAESDAAGRYELQLPTGHWYLETSHPRFAGLEEPMSLEVEPGTRVAQDLTLVAGCVVSGKVLDADGRPANEGALELEYGGGFSPSGKINANGTFKWTTTEYGQVELRAWPWKSPPSPSQKFECRDGALHVGVVFQLPRRGPDIEGMLVDATGAPVPFAYFDLEPLDAGGISQMERSNAEGKWGVFSMPAGRYTLTAYAPDRGVVTTTVTSPSTGVRLQLGGTGTLEGTVKGVTGSVEITLTSCYLESAMVKTAETSRLVAVRDGKFQVTDLPACEITASLKWRSDERVIEADIKAGGTAKVEADFTKPAYEDIIDQPEGTLDEVIESADDTPDEDPTAN
jgi:hypothetical protein